MGPPKASHRNMSRPNTDRVNTTIAMIRPRLGASLTMAQAPHNPSCWRTLENEFGSVTLGFDPEGWPSTESSWSLTAVGRLASVPLIVVASWGGSCPLTPPAIAANVVQEAPPALTRRKMPWASRVEKIDVVFWPIQASQYR